MAELTANPSSPLVSVIIATYNRAHLIPRAIDSVLGQSFTDFELIIIDDGSTDGTEAVVSAYEDARVRYHWTTEGERSRARNLGIALSRGKYVTFLDSDDWYLPEKLAVQSEALEAHPECGLALGGWRIMDEAGRQLQEVRPWEWLSPQPTLQEWLFATTATPITVMVRREWLDRVGGFDVELNYAEDTELWIRLYVAGCRVAWTRENVAVYLVHGANSLRDWQRSRHGRLRFLAQLFRNEAVTSHLGMSREEVLARFYLAFAMQAYAGGLRESAQQDLLQALELHPTLGQDGSDTLLDFIIGHAQSPFVGDDVQFVQNVFDGLPAALSHLQVRRRETLGRVWMSRAWLANRAGQTTVTRQSLWRGLWYCPEYLRNRGVLSMLVQTLVGPRLWDLRTGQRTLRQVTSRVDQA